jgi:hypothetical protein
VRLGGEGAAHRCDGVGLEQGVGIHRQHHVLCDQRQGGVHGPRLAAARQPQPVDLGVAGLDGAQWRGLQPIKLGQHLWRGVGRAVVGDQDAIGGIGLGKQGLKRHRQHQRLVAGGDDHRQRHLGGACDGLGRASEQGQGQPEGEGE